MIELKQSCPPEGNALNVPTDGNKGQSSKPNKYICKKQPQNKPSLESKTETDFQGWCIDLEGYTIDLVPRSKV